MAPRPALLPPLSLRTGRGGRGVVSLTVWFWAVTMAVVRVADGQRWRSTADPAAQSGPRSAGRRGVAVPKSPRQRPFRKLSGRQGSGGEGRCRGGSVHPEPV